MITTIKQASYALPLRTVHVCGIPLTCCPETTFLPAKASWLCLWVRVDAGGCTLLTKPNDSCSFTRFIVQELCYLHVAAWPAQSRALYSLSNAACQLQLHIQLLQHLEGVCVPYTGPAKHLQAAKVRGHAGQLPPAHQPRHHRATHPQAPAAGSTDRTSLLLSVLTRGDTAPPQPSLPSPLLLAALLPPLLLLLSGLLMQPPVALLTLLLDTACLTNATAAAAVAAAAAAARCCCCSRTAGPCQLLLVVGQSGPG